MGGKTPRVGANESEKRNAGPTKLEIPHAVPKPVIYMVCTANATRSPIAAAMLRAHDSEERLDVRSAGVLAAEGQPIGSRTRSALARHGLVDHKHRTKQLAKADADAAHLIIVMEPLHIKWIRRRLPEIADITGSLRRLARYLPLNDTSDESFPLTDAVPLAGAVTQSRTRADLDTSKNSSNSISDTISSGAIRDLEKRVASLRLATTPPEPWEKVADPHFGEQKDFNRCSDELRLLMRELYQRL